MDIPLELAIIGAVAISITAYKLGYDRGYRQGSHQEMLTWVRLLCADRAEEGKDHDPWR